MQKSLSTTSSSQLHISTANIQYPFWIDRIGVGGLCPSARLPPDLFKHLTCTTQEELDHRPLWNAGTFVKSWDTTSQQPPGRRTENALYFRQSSMVNQIPLSSCSNILCVGDPTTEYTLKRKYMNPSYKAGTDLRNSLITLRLICTTLIATLTSFTLRKQ